MNTTPICKNCVHLRDADARHPLCAHPEARRSLVDSSLMQAAASERTEKVAPSYCGPEGNGYWPKSAGGEAVLNGDRNPIEGV
jgi:hypothetical protein